MSMRIQLHIRRGFRFVMLCLGLTATGYLHGQADGTATRINQVRLDPTIQDTISKRTFDNGAFGSVTFKLYLNDSLELDFESLPQRIQNLTFLNQDTLRTTGLLFLEFFVGFAIQVRQHPRDPADIRVVVASQDLPLRLMPDDTSSLSIVVPCRTSMLTMPKEPVFAEGAFISGIVELETQEFLAVDPELPEPMRVRIAVSWYFTSEVFVVD